MAKYNQYIELRPGYESVVDLSSEDRNPGLWQEYIVHEDMRTAIEKICDSLKMEDMNQRRSFWIHGTYGTGKSYAAIVLKHLFTDETKAIEDFFERKTLLAPYKNKFLSIRNRGEGEFLVVWKSGATGISSGLQLMMEMEMSIREALAAKFGKKADYGRNSLVEEAKRIVNDNTFNWEIIFLDPAYHLSDYGDIEAFRQAVTQADRDACYTVARICLDKGIAMFRTAENFENWIADVISSNGLKDKGIVFIWDEFTDYVRKNGEDNILQRLSEFCKKQPFFMFLIVHVDTSWVSQLGEMTYEKIMHRYHELEFHITESAAYEMIGETIKPRAGVEAAWKSIQQTLVKKIIHEFDEVSFGLNERQLLQLCPIHPMALILLTKISENFAASSRTLFSFMKDLARSEQGIGFLSFINNNGPDDWSWLTVDYLWDYFFNADTDIRSFSTEARRTYQLYTQNLDLVRNDPIALRVFKGALLLIAVMSNQRGVTFMQGVQSNHSRIDVTRNTLRKCFCGMLSAQKVDGYLDSFNATNTLLLHGTSGGQDARIELPYGGAADKFEVRLEEVKRNNTRYSLFKKGGEFAQSVEEKLWEKTDATSSRVSLAACVDEPGSVKLRYSEIQAELKRYPFKIGLLAIVIPEPSHFSSAKALIKPFLDEDETKRIAFCIIREPLSDDVLESWYRARVNSELANEEGLVASRERYNQEMLTIRETWSATAVSRELAAFFQENHDLPVYGSNDLRSRMKPQMIFKIFPYAPETVVRTETAFKRAQESAALAGVKLESPNNAQIKNIEMAVKSAKVWDIATIDALEQAGQTPEARAVANLARLIRGKMTQGAKVALDELWLELQKPPFGYFNCLACAYLLGFVFRFWKNSDFNWVNSNSNPFPLTDGNITTMIHLMLQEKVVNHTLSSGSEIWQKFKPYVKEVFGFDDPDVPNEERARFSLIAKIIQLGVPLWAIKRVDEGKVGGSEAKSAYDAIIDQFSLFAQKRASDNQEDIMATIVNLFHGKGRIRKALSEIINDASLRYAAFKAFISEQSGELKQLIQALRLNDNDLFDAIRKLMQASVDTWTEEQVKSKLVDLVEEYRVIDALNASIGTREKTLAAHVKTIQNSFSIMKVPGSVIRKLDFPWFTALEWMNRLRKTPWQNFTPEERTELYDAIRTHGETAWQNINNSKVLLQRYMTLQGITFTDEDVDQVYGEAKDWDYDTSMPVFETVIRNSLSAIKQEHLKAQLLTKWNEISGHPTVQDWCNHYRVPIQWVVPREDLDHFICIAEIGKKKSVSETRLYNAMQFFDAKDTSYLKNKEHIMSRFCEQIGARYRDGFLEHHEAIQAKIIITLGKDVFQWAEQGGVIVGIIDAHLQKINAERFKSSAKARVLSLKEDDLRQRILKAMDDHPELCKYFAN